MKEGIFLGVRHTPGLWLRQGCWSQGSAFQRESRLFLLPCAGTYGEMGIGRRFS